MIQEEKTQSIILCEGFHDRSFWSGLLEWIKIQMVDNAMIAASDLNLVQLIDEPSNIVDAIFAFYEAHEIEPSDEQRQRMLYL